MEIINGIIGCIILGLQIVILLPARIFRSKAKIQSFIPFVTLLLYILYESYFQLPGVVVSVPIRIDLFLLHPVILIGFIVAIIRGILSKQGKGSLIALLSLAGFLYYTLVILKFYQ